MDRNTWSILETGICFLAFCWAILAANCRHTMVTRMRQRSKFRYLVGFVWSFKIIMGKVWK
jgi:hypothetical protein